MAIDERAARNAIISLLKGITLPVGLRVKLDCSSHVEHVRVEVSPLNPKGQFIVFVKNNSFESISLRGLIRDEVEKFVAMEIAQK